MCDLKPFMDWKILLFDIICVPENNGTNEKEWEAFRGANFSIRSFVAAVALRLMLHRTYIYLFMIHHGVRMCVI